MKIVVLIENQAPEGLIAEHGLSLYIEYGKKRYLLDMGASDLFMENASRLGVKLEDVDTAVLSHAHYDHSGGMEAFLSCNQKAEVFLRKGCEENCYHLTSKREKYIGIPKGSLSACEKRIRYVEGDYCLDEGVYLIPHKREGAKQRGEKAQMFRKTKAGNVTEDFSHEQSMVFRCKAGLVVLSSCSHSGILQIVEEVRDTFLGEEILAVIGGFHLMKGSADTMAYTKEEVERLGTTLREEGIAQVYTGHCTGTVAYDVLKRVMQEQLFYLQTGTVIRYCESPSQ